MKPIPNVHRLRRDKKIALRGHTCDWSLVAAERWPRMHRVFSLLLLTSSLLISVHQRTFCHWCVFPLPADENLFWSYFSKSKKVDSLGQSNTSCVVFVVLFCFVSFCKSCLFCSACALLENTNEPSEENFIWDDREKGMWIPVNCPTVRP